MPWPDYWRQQSCRPGTCPPRSDPAANTDLHWRCRHWPAWALRGCRVSSRRGHQPLRTFRPKKKAPPPHRAVKVGLQFRLPSEALAKAGLRRLRPGRACSLGYIRLSCSSSQRALASHHPLAVRSHSPFGLSVMQGTCGCGMNIVTDMYFETDSLRDTADGPLESADNMPVLSTRSHTTSGLPRTLQWGSEHRQGQDVEQTFIGAQADYASTGRTR